MKRKQTNTINQQWARQRNYTFWRIKGLKALVKLIRDDSNKVLVFHELVMLSNMLSELDDLIDNWKRNNIPSKRDYKLNQK